MTTQKKRNRRMTILHVRGIDLRKEIGGLNTLRWFVVTGSAS